MAKVVQGGGMSQASSQSANQTRYFLAANNWSTFDTVEANMSVRYRTAGVLSGLYCVVSANSVSATTTVRSRVNAGNGNQLISIPSSTTGQFEDSSNSDNISSGDTVCYQVITGATGTSIRIVNISSIFEASSNTVKRFSVVQPMSTSTASQTNYTGMVGNLTMTATEANVQTNIKIAGTAKNFFVYISANARTTNTTYRTRKNTANGNMSVSVGSTLTGIFEDTTNTDTLAVDDDYCYQRVTGTGTGTITSYLISVEIETTDNSTLLMTNNAISQNSNLTTYYGLMVGASSSTESHYRSDTRINALLSNLSIRVSSNTINTGTSTVTLRKNGANGNLVVSISASTTGIFEDTTNTDTVLPTDETDYKLTTSGTSGSLNINVTAIKANVLTAVNDQRSAHLVGQATTNSERSAIIKGKDSSNSERAGKLKGKALTNSERSGHVTGYDTTTSERGAKLTGGLVVNSERGGHLFSNAQAISERASKIIGKDTSSDQRSAHMTGGQPINDQRSAKLTGKDTTISQRLAKITGSIDVNSERNAKLRGKSTANSERQAHLIGEVLTNNERATIITGQESTTSERSGHLFGKDTATSQRSATLIGKDTASSERLGKLTGQDSATSERNVSLRGGENTNAERSATIHGVLTDNSERSGKITGKDTATSERSAHLVGEDYANSEREVILRGQLVIVSEMLVHLFGKDFANSERASRLHGIDTVFSERGCRLVGKATIGRPTVLTSKYGPTILGTNEGSTPLGNIIPPTSL